MHVLAILGMHRSGTSLLAQACAACGISPGPTGELLSAQADNPEGFFENRQLVELNDQLLETAQGSWYSPPDPGVFLAGTEHAACAALLTHLDAHSKGSFFLKDPRLCLTWPIWAASSSDFKVLFVYRSPLAVAKSLARRNGFPLQLGLQLWELYNRSCLQALQAQDYVAVSYDQLSRGELSLPDAVERLSALGFSVEPERASQLFKSSLQHFDADAGDAANVLMSDAQVALAEHCEGLCRGQAITSPECVDDAPLLANIQDLARALGPLARVVETGLERDEARALSVERAEDRDTALRALETLESDHGALAAAHASERECHAQAAQTLARLEGEHNALADAHRTLESAQTHAITQHQKLVHLHDALHQERAALEQEHATLAENYWQLNDTRQKLDAEVQDLESQRKELTDKADYLFFALTESYRKLLELELSPLGKLQRLTRRLYRLATFRRGQNSAQEDLLASAHQHFEQYAIALPQRPPGKLQQLSQVTSYVLRNPAASLRSFSWHRLRRVSAVFLGASTADLNVWVKARFPESDEGHAGFDQTALDPDFDHLELQFPVVDKPLVSIIVPVFNDYRVTINCLNSILSHSADIEYEVIVADDCSTDLTTSIEARIRGISVMRTEHNVRFLRNCKNAATTARGRYLLFLNNDTAVTQGWLSALLKPFADPRVGVVGPKLLFADGTLQEAGGIVWRDASGWNFGRGDDPGEPAYCYRRDVDYVSGACLILPRELWSQLDGFDERFVPAYYEDADLCFAARAAGYRVVYEPTSVVYHFEGVSNGTDLTAGVKQHQLINQEVFREKWCSTLDAEHFPNAEHVVHARDRSAAKPCILVIDHYVPHHDKDAGSRSTFMYLRLLLDLGCRVQFLGANFFPHQPYTAELQAMGVEVLVGETLARGLDEWLSQHAPYIDEVFIHRPHVAEQFLSNIEGMRPRPNISYFGHDLHFLRTEREARLKNDSPLAREAKKWQQRELAVFDRVDRIYYFSAVEIAVLAKLTSPAKLRCVPLYPLSSRPIPAYAPEDARSMLFVGGYNHPPNVDAATWLAREIMPLVLQDEPAARLHLVGSNPPEEVLALAGEHVQVHGYLTDSELNALYAKVAVAVVPLRYGAGVKGKVIEAITHGVPIVTTQVGAEGIPDAENVMHIADDASDLAGHLSRLFADRTYGSAQLKAYANWLETHFSAGLAAGILKADIPSLAKSGDE